MKFAATSAAMFCSGSKARKVDASSGDNHSGCCGEPANGRMTESSANNAERDARSERIERRVHHKGCEILYKRMCTLEVKFVFFDRKLEASFCLSNTSQRFAQRQRHFAEVEPIGTISGNGRAVRSQRTFSESSDINFGSNCRLSNARGSKLRPEDSGALTCLTQ